MSNLDKFIEKNNIKVIYNSSGKPSYMLKYGDTISNFLCNTKNITLPKFYSIFNNQVGFNNFLSSFLIPQYSHKVMNLRGNILTFDELKMIWNEILIINIIVQDYFNSIEPASIELAKWLDEQVSQYIESGTYKNMLTQDFYDNLSQSYPDFDKKIEPFMNLADKLNNNFNLLYI